MKFTELLRDQLIIVQLCWGERKIEFTSAVLGREDDAIFVTPYMHGGSELQLNVTKDKDVICNVFTDQPVTKQRISWRNVELTTVNRKGRVVYSLRTYGFNNVAAPDDRRRNNRMVVQVDGQVFDGQTDNGVDVTIRDISDVGISFYAKNFTPQSSQIVVTFSDDIDDKKFNARVECVISRLTVENGQQIAGCRIVGGNRDYQLYCFIRHLLDKNRNRNAVIEGSEGKTDTKPSETSTDGNESKEDITSEAQTKEVKSED